jgi:hypothetical protein
MAGLPAHAGTLRWRSEACEYRHARSAFGGLSLIGGDVLV